MYIISYIDVSADTKRCFYDANMLRGQEMLVKHEKAIYG